MHTMLHRASAMEHLLHAMEHRAIGMEHFTHAIPYRASAMEHLPRAMKHRMIASGHRAAAKPHRKQQCPRSAVPVLRSPRSAVSPFWGLSTFAWLVAMKQALPHVYKVASC